jgi:hypothetical protein
MLVGWSVCPHITSKTDYVAIPSRLGFGDPLVYETCAVISSSHFSRGGFRGGFRGRGFRGGGFRGGGFRRGGFRGGGFRGGGFRGGGFRGGGFRGGGFRGGLGGGPRPWADRRDSRRLPSHRVQKEQSSGDEGRSGATTAVGVSSSGPCSVGYLRG